MSNDNALIASRLAPAGSIAQAELAKMVGKAAARALDAQAELDGIVTRDELLTGLAKVDAAALRPLAAGIVRRRAMRTEGFGYMTGIGISGGIFGTMFAMAATRLLPRLGGVAVAVSGVALAAWMIKLIVRDHREAQRIDASFDSGIRAALAKLPG